MEKIFEETTKLSHKKNIEKERKQVVVYLENLLNSQSRKMYKNKEKNWQKPEKKQK